MDQSKYLEIMRDALALQKEGSQAMYEALTYTGIENTRAINFVNGVMRDVSSGKHVDELLPVYFRISDDLLEHLIGFNESDQMIKVLARATLHNAIYAFVTAAETASSSYTEAVLLMIKTKGGD